jgi:hypothetical protein
VKEKPVYRLVKAVNGRWAIKNSFNEIDYNFMPKQITRDNKAAYNARSGGESNSIRVPSLKRSDKVWRNFYNLFPNLKGLKTYRGCKLKKVS